MARHFKLNSSYCLDPGELKTGADEHNLPDHFWGLANGYSCPQGMEPGSAWVVVSRATVDALDMDAYHTLTITSEFDTATIGNLSVARAICTAQDGDSKAAYLIELQDVRRVLKMSSVAKQYNVRAPAALYDTGNDVDIYHEETIDTSAIWTWATMFADLWTFLPTIAGAAPTLPYAPLGQPENFRFLGMSAWDAIGEVLQEIGCAMAFNPLTGVFSVVRIGEAQDGLAAAMDALTRRLLFDYKPKPNLHRAEMPETIRVFFPRREVHRGTERETPRTGNWEAAPLTAVDVATNIAGAAPGTVMAVWSQLPAFANFDGTVNNQAELDARAAEIAGNIENGIDVAEPLRKHYSGIATTILPGEQINEVIWRDFGDDDGQITEIRQNLKLPSAVTDGTVRRCRFWPSHRKHAQPAYPDLLHIVQVKADSPGIPEGDQSEPTADGLFYGSVTRYNPDGGTFTVAEDCWIEAVNETELVVGQRYLGRLNGSATSATITRPVYLIERDEPGSSGILFTLTEDMDGNVALAEVNLSWGRFPVPDEDTQVWVFDLQSLFARALSGARGLAIWDQDSEIYHVVECESKAGLVRAETTTTFSGGLATATVVGFTGTQQDRQDPGATIEIRDDEAFFANAQVGTTIYSLLDVINNEYVAMQGRGPSGWLVISAYSDLTVASITDSGGTELDGIEPPATDTFPIEDPLGLLDTVDDGTAMTMFTIFDNNPISPRYVVVATGPTIGGRLGKTDASHAKGASGTVSIWSGTPGSEGDTGVNVTAYNRFADLESGKWCWVAWNGIGWYLTAGEC